MRNHPPSVSFIQNHQTNSDCDQQVPGNTSVYCTNYTMGRRKELWRDPDSFVPERWLGDEKYASDQRDSFAPFSLGPRNCIGRK